MELNEWKQAVFTMAYRGLKIQGWKKSLDAFDKCEYRGKGGKACAVGWLIPDEKVTPEIFGCGLNHTVQNALADFLLPLPEAAACVNFLVELQVCHDLTDPHTTMKSRLENLARDNNLQIPPPAPWE